MKESVPLSPTSNQQWRSSCTCIERNNTQLFSLIHLTFPSHPLHSPSLPYFSFIESLPYVFTVFTSLHSYAPSTCVSPRSFPLRLLPRRWLLPLPALWVSRLVPGCRVSPTGFLYQCHCFWTDLIIRRRLQDHRRLRSRLFGFEAVYFHRSNVLRRRWSRSREPMPGRPANPPCSC